MLPINKNSNNPLVDFCRRRDVTYDDIPHSLKLILNDSLLKEQGYLCAYCMSRISQNNMSVEHWKPRHPNINDTTLSARQKEEYRQLEINYKNMLAVCPGNEGQPAPKQHCDRKKRNLNLSYNPSRAADHPKLRIFYIRNTGEIKSEDPIFNEEINNILNLNCEKLKNNRLDVIDHIFSALDKLEQNANRNKIQSILNKWKSVNRQGEMEEYAGVAIYFLEKRLHKNS